MCFPTCFASSACPVRQLEDAAGQADDATWRKRAPGAIEVSAPKEDFSSSRFFTVK
jgi:hypothetical protein